MGNLHRGVRRRRPLIIAIVGIILVSGCESPVTTDRVAPFDRVEVTATIESNGEAELRSTFHLEGAAHAKLRIDTPADGAVTDVTANGNPVRVTGDMTIVDIDGPTVEVVTTMLGTVERTDQSAELRLPLWRQTGQSADADPLIPMNVEVRLPNLPPAPAASSSKPSSKDRWLGIDRPVATRSDQAITMRGTFHPSRNVTAVLAVPGAQFAAVRSTPAVQPGSRRVERVYDAVERADHAFFDRAASARRTRDRIAVGYWSLLAFLVVLPLAVACIGALRALLHRRAAAVAAPERLSEPPDELLPPLIALVDQGAGRLGRRAVAGSLLALIDSGAIEMQAVTSTDFRVRPVAGAATTHPPSDVALVNELTRLGVGDADRWVSSPLPLVLDGPWWSIYCRNVTRDARAAQLITRRFPRALFVCSVIALLITSAPLWGSSPNLAAAAVGTALVLLALSALGGYRLTTRGLDERAHWKAFERHASESIELQSVSVPAITVWGRHLIAATALGVNDTILDSVCRRDGSTDAKSRPTVTTVATSFVVAALTLGALRAGPATAAETAVPTTTPMPTCAVGSRTDVRNRSFEGRPQFAGADLTCQDLHDLDLGQFDLTGADLRRADLHGASFTQAVLTDAQLAEADLRGARLGQATLHRAVFDRADLRGADFTQAELVRASLRDAKANGTDFGQASMPLADLRGIDASNADFVQTKLVRVDASNARFDGSDFTQADLGESDFTGSSLVRADLGVTSASATVFGSADLHDAKWVDTLRHEGADLAGAEGLPRSQAKAWLRTVAILAVGFVLLVVIVTRSRSFIRKR